jgi:PRTRC genetic system protein A
MFPDLVTYHIHASPPLPPNDAGAYQYILAGNGLFVRGTTPFYRIQIRLHAHLVRGLAPLQPRFQLTVPRIPAQLLDPILDDARRARDRRGALSEALYHLHHDGRTVRVRRPRQRATPTRVTAAGDDAPTLLCELHSHGKMAAFWSKTDDADEGGARLYAVIGKVDGDAPEIRVRAGLYGYRLPLPATAVFTGPGPFRDLHTDENTP